MANFYDQDPVVAPAKPPIGWTPTPTNGNPFAQFGGGSTTPPVDTVWDAAQGLGTGIVQGTEGLIGLPGTIGNFLFDNPLYSIPSAFSQLGHNLNTNIRAWQGKTPLSD